MNRFSAATNTCSDRVALLGANGSGKSTLLRLLDGLYFANTGEVRFRGEPLTEQRFAADSFAHAFRRRVGLVFQNPDVQLFNPTVFDEVAFGPLHAGWSRSEVRDRVAGTLHLLRIAHLKDRSPQRLSGGEKKRVALDQSACFENQAAVGQDEALLDRTNLIHSHRHRHGHGLTHSHSHLHRP